MNPVDALNEIAAQVADGQLKKTEGIGGTTYEVIREALDGRVPADRIVTTWPVERLLDWARG